MSVFDPSDLALVRASPLLAGMSDSAFRALASVATVRSFQEGGQIFLQGEPATYFFIVLEGWVKVFRLTPAGGEAVLAVFTQGQSFAEAAAFTDGRFPASAEAVTPVRLMSFQSGSLRRLMAENPEIGLSMLASTSVHLHLLVQQIEQLKARTGAQRVAEFLLSLTDAQGERPNPLRINLPYDKTLIAGRLGMQPESLSRAFAKLRPLGVAIEHSVAIISDPVQLRHFALSDADAAG